MASNVKKSGKSGGVARHLSMLAAWGVAFGCAVGWDAFTMPGTEFLPKAGPLGTLLGLLVGGLAMGVVAWNYHCMVRRHPGPGGVYSYATAAFGSDHGFICAWFLCLTYIAIVWADSTALVMVARYLLGKFPHFGFAYTVAGMEVTLADLLVSLAGIVLAAAVCCRRVLSGKVQAALALVLAGGIAVCFCAAAAKYGHGGLRSMEPAFSPLAGKAGPLGQVLAIVALSPWLFVGFEAVSNLSGEFRFPARRAFWVMVAALGAAVAAYALLTAIPSMVPLAHAEDWPDGLTRLRGGRYPGFAVAARSLGGKGPAVMAAVLLSAVFTNLVGNTMAASRLLAAMADDGALPRWLGRKSRDGAPRNAVLAIAVLSVGISALGRTVIDVIVDIAVVGAGIAYAYTSAAAWKAARDEGNRAGKALGLCGLVFSVAIAAAFVLPTVGAGTAAMATESYLVVVLWCIAGLVSFMYVFTHDRRRRFGQSTVVWLSLLAIVLGMSGLWIRQATYDTTAAAFEDIIRHHVDVCVPSELEAAGGDYWVGHAPAAGGGHRHAHDDWRETLRTKLVAVNRSIVRNSLVQVGLAVLAFGLMFCLYSILRRRERDLEREKARAKSYFFSTVSHDIRTPLNAIIGFSEMLKTGFRTEEERQQAIDSILVSGKTLLGLINDVLDLSKLESGKMDIVPEPTDCPQLLRGVMDAFRVAADKPGLELRCRIGDMPPLMLDPQRLRQIVFNIVGNAVKFTEKGHVELRGAYVRAKDAETGEFRLVVEDTGCGIGQEDLERLGSAYVQVGTRATRNGGTGLGLAICRQLTAAMGGHLGIESELGRGSTFTVTIPDVRPAPEKGEGEDGDRPDADLDDPSGADAMAAGGGVGEAAPPRRAVRPVKRILIADDSKMNLMVLQAHLKHLGDYDIALASDGREALALLEAPGTAPFDLVLTDMWMPNLDGSGLLQAIRANPALAGLRVAIVTADVEMQSTAEGLGFDSILFKPVTSANLAKLLTGE